MRLWLTRLALVLFGLLAAALAGRTVLGAASADTHVTELIVTCLSCGEQWIFAPTTTVGAGFLSLFKRRKLADTCPKCGSRAVTFAHAGRTAQDHDKTA